MQSLRGGYVSVIESDPQPIQTKSLQRPTSLSPKLPTRPSKDICASKRCLPDSLVTLSDTSATSYVEPVILESTSTKAEIALTTYDDNARATLAQLAGACQSLSAQTTLYKMRTNMEQKNEAAWSHQEQRWVCNSYLEQDNLASQSETVIPYC